MEKRVKKHLRKNKFKKNDSLLVIGTLEHYLLTKSLQGLPVNITARKKVPPNTAKFKRLIIGKTMDQTNEEVLTALFQGKITKQKKSKFFNILEPLTDQEVLQYAKLKKIPFSIKKRSNSGRKLLTSLAEFKEIKYNLSKNIKKLKEKILILV